MGFKNVMLTKEERADFKNKKIKNPKNKDEILAPYYCTIDKERNMHLINISGERDYPNEKLFIFLWNNQQVIVQFSWQKINGKYSWNIPNENDYITKDKFPYSIEPGFLEDLRNALFAFGAMGMPDEQNSATIVCNF